MNIHPLIKFKRFLDRRMDGWSVGWSVHYQLFLFWPTSSDICCVYSIVLSDIDLLSYDIPIAVGQWLVSGLQWSSTARQSLAARQKELSEMILKRQNCIKNGLNLCNFLTSFSSFFYFSFLLSIFFLFFAFFSLFLSPVHDRA